MHTGLSDQEVVERIERFGYNELTAETRRGFAKIILDLLREPMFLLLLSCASLYVIIGDYLEGIVLMSTTLIIILITVFQSQKTEKALQSLKKLSSPRALVIRSGITQRIAGRDVVPDDIILLNEGDRIVGDAELLESNNLCVDESLLTGESFPVAKRINDLELKKVFSGTLVIRGNAIARVTATGNRTEFGRLGVSLTSIERQETLLQKELKKLIRTLFLFGILLSAGVVVAYYLSRNHFTDALLIGLSTAMAVLPEEFPVVLTVFLALGAWRLSKKKLLTRDPASIETLGATTVLCSDKTGTITLNQMMVSAYATDTVFTAESGAFSDNRIVKLIRTALSACSEQPIDPMETAIVSKADEFLIKNEGKPIKTFPFSDEMLAVTNIFNQQGGRYLACSKGAPETIFRLCQLSEEEVTERTILLRELASKGWRVLAIAEAELSDLPDKQENIHMSYLGLLAFEDPIRPEVPEAIRICHNAGIKVLMITGDYPETGFNIAKKAGLADNPVIMTGAELDAMDNNELLQKIGGVDVFARVVPEQKLRIVNSLKANNEIVAMTGDGVNDAPALKAADIGIAMGNKGTDVAREAASLVLLDDNFATIVSAISSGRRIYDNLEKAMSYIVAVHIPIIGLTLLPAFNSTLPILLMPLHIVFMELIIDPVSSVVFEAEKEEIGLMNRLPRNKETSLFGGRKILMSLFQGILLFGMVMFVFFLTVDEGHTPGEARAIMFTSMIMGNIVLVVSNLSHTRNAFVVVRQMNLSFILIVTAAVALLLFSVYVPFLAKLFGFENPGIEHFGPAVAGALSILLVLELFKKYRYKNERSGS